MSKRNANTPLPNIGATEWGATLNNYLRAQEYNQKEIKDELANTIAAKNSTVAVNLSSGVVDTILEGGIHPGLYDGDDRLSHGAQLGTDKDYHYRGRVVFIADNNYTKEYSDAVDGENILDLSGINSEGNDGWAVYLCYTSQSYKILQVSMNTNNVSDTNKPNSSIILDPNYILLGFVLKINGTCYWYEKTMISSDSITTKSWHLTQSFANLNTYFNCQNGYLLPYTAEGVDATLLVQGYGLAPFSNNTGTNPNTNSHKNIIQQTLATYTGTPAYNFKVLSKLGPNISLNEHTVQYTFNEDLLYRLCATGIQLNNTPVLLLQEAISGDTFTPTNSENIDFINMILPFVDCVELYRFDGGSPTTLKAAPGNGISSVNANGLNPHITTVIRDEDEVYFGNSEDDNFTFKTTDETTGYQLSGKHTIAIPNDSVSDRWMLLNKTTLDTSIQLQTNKENSTIKLSAQEVNDSNQVNGNYSNIQLSHYCVTITNNRGNKNSKLSIGYDGTEDPSDKIELRNEGNRIKLYEMNGIQLQSNVVSFYEMDRKQSQTELYANFNYNANDKITSFVMGPTSDSNKQITLTAGEQPMIKVGGGAELRHDGLYLPSGGSGIEIGKLTAGQIKATIEVPYTSILKIPQWKWRENTNITWENDDSYFIQINDNKVYGFSKSQIKEELSLSYNGTILEFTSWEQADIRCKIGASTSRTNCPNTLIVTYRYTSSLASYTIKLLFTTNLDIVSKLCDTTTIVKPDIRESQTIYYCIGGLTSLRNLDYIKFKLLTPYQGREIPLAVSLKQIKTSSSLFLQGDVGPIFISTLKGTGSIQSLQSGLWIGSLNSQAELFIDEYPSGLIQIGIDGSDITLSKRQEGEQNLWCNKYWKIKDTDYKLYQNMLYPVSNFDSLYLPFIHRYLKYFPDHKPCIVFNKPYNVTGDSEYSPSDTHTYQVIHSGKRTTNLRSLRVTNHFGCLYEQHQHQWIKIQIRSGQDGKIDGYCEWSIYALTGVVNKYRWEKTNNDGKVVFWWQLGKNGGVESWDNITIDLSRDTNNPFYLRNILTTNFNDVKVDMKIKYLFDKNLYGFYSTAQLDDSYPVLWHIINEDNSGADGEYPVKLQWSDPKRSPNILDAVEAPFIYHIIKRVS